MSGVGHRGGGRGARAEGRAEALGDALGRGGGLLWRGGSGGGREEGRQSRGWGRVVRMWAWSGKEQGAGGGRGPRAVGVGLWGRVGGSRSGAL